MRVWATATWPDYTQPITQPAFAWRTVHVQGHGTTVRFGPVCWWQNRGRTAEPGLLSPCILLPTLKISKFRSVSNLSQLLSCYVSATLIPSTQTAARGRALSSFVQHNIENQHTEFCTRCVWNITCQKQLGRRPGNGCEPSISAPTFSLRHAPPVQGRIGTGSWAGFIYFCPAFHMGLLEVGGSAIVYFSA